MSTTETTFEVREHDPNAWIIDIHGDVTPDAEDALVDAYNRACEHQPDAVLLNFSSLQYMNSGGIGLLVTLLVRAQRAHQRLLAFGLSDHYRQILQLTRLDEAIEIHDSEEAASAAAGR